MKKNILIVAVVIIGLVLIVVSYQNGSGGGGTARTSESTSNTGVTAATDRYRNFPVKDFPYTNGGNSNPYAYDKEVLYITTFEANQWIGKSALATTGSESARQQERVTDAALMALTGFPVYSSTGNGTRIYIKDIPDRFLKDITGTVEAQLVYIGAQTFQMANGSSQVFPVFEFIGFYDASQATTIDTQVKAHYDRSVEFYNQGNWDSAIREINEIIKLIPDEVYIYFYRGNVYANKGDYDKAIADYTQAIRLDSNHTDAYFHRGVIYNDIKGDYDKAIADFSQVIRLNPNAVDAYINRGIAYSNKNDDDRSIADWETALLIEPNNTNARNFLIKAYHYPFDRGLLLYRQGDLDAAIREMTLAIRLNPTNAEAYLRRGTTYHSRQEYDAAIADFTEAIKVNPKEIVYVGGESISLDALAYASRSFAYKAKGDTARADADFAKALELGY